LAIVNVFAGFKRTGGELPVLQIAIGCGGEKRQERGQ
jgi:hypothetical protein